MANQVSRGLPPCFPDGLLTSATHEAPASIPPSWSARRLGWAADLEWQSDQIELLSERVPTLSQEVQILKEEVRHPPGPQ